MPNYVECKGCGEAMEYWGLHVPMEKGFLPKDRYDCSDCRVSQFYAPYRVIMRKDSDLAMV
ncbi:hypothetical protein [Nocardia sp. IFM 10818]